MKTFSILSSLKSRYFMLMACVTLLLGATACSSEEFGIEVPEAKKEWTKQELIELALSQMGEISRTPHLPAQMITIKDTVSIKCNASEEMTIVWETGEENKTIVPANSNVVYTHVYTDGKPSHYITIEGSMEAALNLNVNNNKLIFLEVNAPRVTYLYCENNYLDSLDLAGGPILRKLIADNNEISFLDVSRASLLMDLRASHNRLKEIQLPKYNSNFHTLMLSDNRITEIDLTCNRAIKILLLDKNLITDLDLNATPYLAYINLSHLPLKTFNGNPIGAGDFSMYKGLSRILLANTSFTSLDLSQNPSVIWIDISETSITTLDITNLSNITYLYASYSELTNLEYIPTNLSKLCDLRIERTPWENKWEETLEFISSLPDRKNTTPGTLYTYSLLMNSFVLPDNWVINP